MSEYVQRLRRSFEDVFGGFALAFDFDIPARPTDADVTANIASYWKAVGNDIRTATARFGEEHPGVSPR